MWILQAGNLLSAFNELEPLATHWCQLVVFLREWSRASAG